MTLSPLSLSLSLLFSYIIRDISNEHLKNSHLAESRACPRVIAWQLLKGFSLNSTSEGFTNSTTVLHGPILLNIEPYMKNLLTSLRELWAWRTAHKSQKKIIYIYILRKLYRICFVGDLRFPQLCRKGCRPSSMRSCFEFSMVLQNAYPTSSSVRSQAHSDSALESRAPDSSDFLVPVRLFLRSVRLETEDDERTRYTRQALSLPAVAMQLHHKYSEYNLYISLHPSINHFDSPPFLQFSTFSSPPHLLFYIPHFQCFTTSIPYIHSISTKLFC
jgi:hypothetical protein